MTTPSDREDAEALLRAQLADLARFRQVVDAQRAVLKMEDDRLLGAFAREATEIADAVLARDSVLLALRSAAQASRRPWDPRLDSDVDTLRTLASQESLALARQMERAATGIARDLEGVGRRLDQVMGPHFGVNAPGQPVLVDRTG